MDVAILGAGPAGMVAYREAVKQTDRVALMDGGRAGTCTKPTPRCIDCGPGG